MKALILTLLAACAATAPDSTPHKLAPGDSLTLSWTYGSNTACEGCTERQRVECGAEVSHPCPFVTFAQTLDVTGDSAVFTDATGGANANGVPAEQLPPWVDPLQFWGDSVVFPQRGDDSGLRHEAHLKQRPDGVYEASVEWTLFNVAGYTTFHVEGVLQ